MELIELDTGVEALSELSDDAIAQKRFDATDLIREPESDGGDEERKESESTEEEFMAIKE